MNIHIHIKSLQLALTGGHINIRNILNDWLFNFTVGNLLMLALERHLRTSNIIIWLHIHTKRTLFQTYWSVLYHIAAFLFPSMHVQYIYSSLKSHYSLQNFIARLVDLQHTYVCVHFYILHKHIGLWTVTVHVFLCSWL